MQYDGYRFNSDLVDLDGRAESDQVHDFRRIELVLRGKLAGGADWVVGYDARSEVFLDVALRQSFGGDGRHNLVLGQFKQPNGLEELGRSVGNDFIVKATATNTYAISRRLGLGYVLVNEDWTVAASAFGRELSRGQDVGSGFAARVTWVPVRSERGLVHLGLSHVDRDTDADTLRLRARANSDLGNVRLVDSGTLTDTDRIAITGVEGLWLKGPLKLQGEFFRASVARYGDAGNYNSDGAYLSAVWNLGGPDWRYRSGIVAAPTATDAGLWQLGLRLDTLDLDDGEVAGGHQDALTAGVNWYWGEHMKLMLNHVRVHSRRHGVEDDPDVWQGRVQLHW